VLAGTLGTAQSSRGRSWRPSVRSNGHG
jgi:hypothetical protein